MSLPPQNITISLEPASVVADGVSTGWVYATITDSANQPYTDPSGTVVPSKAAGDDITFTSSRLSHRGSGLWRVGYKASKTSGNNTITVTAQNAQSVSPATKSATLVEKPAAAHTVEVSLSPANIPADGVSKSTATVTIKDVNGNGVYGETVNVGTTGDTTPAQTVTDNGNGTYTTTITASTTPGTETIVVTAGGLTGSAPLTEFGPLDSLVFTLDPATVVADGAATSTAKAVLKDAGGRGVSNRQVAIALETAGVGDSTVSNVTNHGTGEYTAVITSSKTAGVEKYKASIAGSTMTALAELNETPGPVSTVTLALNPTSIVADGSKTSTATATLKDVNNNFVKGETVLISKAQGSAVTISDVVNNNDGTYSATVTSSKTAGNEVITATVPSVNKSANATLTQTPGPSSNVTVTLTPSTITADGTSTSKAVAAVKDANGNPVKNEVVLFSATGDVGVGSTVTNKGDGTYETTITASNTAGTSTITAKANSTQASGSATLTEVAGPATTVVLTLTPNELVADGTSKATAAAKVTDAKGNPVTNETVTITRPTTGDSTVSAVTPHPTDAGVYVATITAGTKAGTELITATATKANKSGTAALLEKPGPASDVTMLLEPSSMPANGTSTSKATMTVKDANGNVIVDEIVNMASNGNAAVSPVTNQNNGTYTATITSSTTPGVQTITGTATKADKSASAPLTLFGATQTITVTANPTSVPADGAAKGTVSALLKDAAGNPVSNATVGFGTNGNITFGPVVNKGNGVYESVYTASTTPGTETITATGGGKIGTTQIVEFGPATTVSVSLSPSTVTADGVETSTATATLKDANNNPVLNETVVFSSSGDALPGATTNAGNGVYTSVVKSSKTAGVETITAKATKANKTGTASLTEVAGPATLVTLALSPASIPADGESTSTAVATVKDANGNLVNNETVTLSVTGDTVALNDGATTNNNDGTYTGTLKSSTKSGIETVTATAGSGAFGTAALTQTAGTPASITLVLSPSTIPAGGEAQSIATATVKDAQGNLVRDGVVTITTDGDTVVSPVTNNNNGSYTSTITSSTTAGVETISAAVEGVATPATAQLTESSGPVSSLTVTLDPAVIVADGVSTTTATATVKDSFGNAVTDETVSFAKDGQVVVPEAANNGDGTYTGVITSSTVAGPKQITASTAESEQDGSAILTEVPGALSNFTLTLDPTSIVADGQSVSNAMASLSDANGNAITDEVVTITTNGDTTPGTVVNGGDGTYTSAIKASTKAGAETITAKATKADTTRTATLTETAGAISKLTFSLNKSEVQVGSLDPVKATAVVKDVNDNPITNAVVTIATNGDTSVSPVTNNNNGDYTANITPSTTAGQETITASIASANKTATAKLTETAAAANKVTLVLAPASITANGLQTSLATATVKDVYGNLVSNETVAYKTNGDVKLGPVTNKGNGTYTSTITASRTAGTELITATATKANKSGTAELLETLQSGGYWLTAGDGGIFTYGNAKFHGSIGGTVLNQPVVGMAATPDKGGYWQVATDGGIFNYGNAPFHGSMGGKPLNAPIVGMAPTIDGSGYWLVGQDGGIFSFNAPFRGSTGGMKLNKPIVGMTADPDGDGYWFVASDGGIFAYNAEFRGSLGGAPPASPIVGMKATPDGKGYWLVTQDGTVYPFGTATQRGHIGGLGVNDIVGMSPTASGKGYWLTGKDGGVYAFGDAVQQGSPKAAGLKLVSPISGVEGF